MNFRFPSELISKLQKKAEQENRSLNNLIETILLESIETKKK